MPPLPSHNAQSTSWQLSGASRVSKHGCATIRTRGQMTFLAFCSGVSSLAAPFAATPSCAGGCCAGWAVLPTACSAVILVVLSTRLLQPTSRCTIELRAGVAVEDASSSERTALLRQDLLAPSCHTMLACYTFNCLFSIYDHACKHDTELR
jgi:hypothetical protein